MSSNNTNVSINDHVCESQKCIFTTSIIDLDALKDYNEKATALNDVKYASKTNVEKLINDVLDNEETTAAALNDLNSRLDSIEDSIEVGDRLAAVAYSGSYNDLSNKPTIPSEVTDSTVSGWGFTKNTGTVIAVETGDVVEDMDEFYTNTAHSHSAGAGLEITGSGGISGNTEYELKIASDKERGGFETGYSQNGKNYPVQMSGNKAFVNVPWTDTNTNTTYSFTSGTNGFTVTPSGGSAQTVTVTPSISSLNIKVGANDKVTYDGSAEKSINITASDLGLSAALIYRGTTTTALSDGASTNPIIIDGVNYTAEAGCLVFYGDKEYVYNGSKWEELGYARQLILNKVTTGSNSSSATVASQGHTHNVGADTTNTVSVSTAGHTHSVSKTSTTGTGVATSTHTHGFTPAGSVSSSFSGSDVTSGTAQAGSNNANLTSVATAAHTHGTNSTGSHTHSVTAAGSVSSSFTGSAVTSGTPNATNGTVSVATAAHTHSVSGGVQSGGASHTHSVSGNTGSGGNAHSHPFTPSGSISLSGSESGGVLTITATFSGTGSTTGSTTDSHTHGISFTSGATTASHTHAFSTTTAATPDNTTNRVSVAGNAHTHNVTAAGSVSSSFSGSSVTSGSAGDHSHTANAAASNTTNVVSMPNASHTHNVKAAGSVSSSFSGSAGTTSSISGTVTVASQEHTHSTEASGSKETVSKSTHNHTASATSTTGTTVAAHTHTHEVTPTGSIS